MRPCPFCGSEKSEVKNISVGSWVYCGLCGSCGPMMEDWDVAVKLWNRRVVDEEVSE